MEKKTVGMYDPFQIGNLTVKNRLIRSATFEFGADNGRITPGVIELYRELAAGGSGLIISGMEAVLPGAGISPTMIQTTYDPYVDNMKQLADAVHENGSLLFVQLNHAGYKAAKSDGFDHLGPSEREVSEGHTYHEATLDEIRMIIEAFGKAAKRCKEAGCDGVQIHAAHGFLINTFLAPYFNHRTDAYGGSIENRSRILFEVYDAVRNEVGNNYPVSVKLHFSDLVSPSITPDECVYVSKELEKRGVDMIEISSGVNTTAGGEATCTPLIKQEGPFLAGAAQVAKSVNVPIVSVCGYRTPDFIEKALNETDVTAVSFCRPLIREPNLPNRWKTDRTKATCVSCGLCYKSSGIIACQVKK